MYIQKCSWFNTAGQKKGVLKYFAPKKVGVLPKGTTQIISNYTGKERGKNTQSFKACSDEKWSLYFNILLLKVWSVDQQDQHSLEVHQKYRITGPTSVES